MGVSKNIGNPKSSILIGFSIINHPFWGTPIFGTSILSKFAFLSFAFRSPRGLREASGFTMKNHAPVI